MSNILRTIRRAPGYLGDLYRVAAAPLPEPRAAVTRYPRRRSPLAVIVLLIAAAILAAAFVLDGCGTASQRPLSEIRRDVCERNIPSTQVPDFPTGLDPNCDGACPVDQTFNPDTWECV